MVERIRVLLESRQMTPTQFADAIGVARPIVSHILSGRNKPSLEVVQRILAAMPDLAMPWLLNGTGEMLVTPVSSTGASRSNVAPAPVPTTSPAPPSPFAATPIENAESVTAYAKPATPVRPPVAPALPVSGGAQAADFEDSVVAPAPINAGSRLTAPVAGQASQSHTNNGYLNEAKAGVLRAVTMPKRFSAAALKSKQPFPAPAASLDIVEHEPLMAPMAVPPVAVPSIAAPQPTAELPVAPPAAPSVSSQANMGPVEDASSTSLASALFAGAEKPIRRIVIFYRDGSFADYQPE